MNFRIAVLGQAPPDAAARAALLRQVEQDTGVDRPKLEARLAEAAPWLADLESPDKAETLRARWEALHPVHLTVFPLRAPVAPAPTPAGPWAEPTVLTPESVPEASEAALPAPETTPTAAPPASPPTSAPAGPAAPAAPAGAAARTGAMHRPPTMLRPGRVLDMRIEAPPKRTSRLFVLLLVIGGLAAAKSWRDWYTERPIGGIQGQAGTHCADGPGHFSVGSEESMQRFERGDATGHCNPDSVANPMGCDRPNLLNGVRTLQLGTAGGLDLVLALPTGTESVIEPGTYEVRGPSEEQPTAMSNRPRCSGWSGTVTIDSLTWQVRPRATSHARWEAADVSARWDLVCLNGAPQRFQGCFVYEGTGGR